ncbi:MAG TPA: helix-turn-helix transcriptional regulator [Acidimicrobiia bacterium]
MPDRTFGRTVRYRRTKLGMSQTQLAELVGRSTSTIRSWERDKSRPNDTQVLSALAAILGIDERQLFEKAEVDLPDVVESSPTVEQALATLSMEEAPVDDDEPIVAIDPDLAPRPTVVPVEQFRLDLVEVGERFDEDGFRNVEAVREKVLVSSVEGPAFAAPPDPYVQTPLTPTVADLSYIEDDSQRQLYRVRNLATLVAVVALIVTLIWAFGEGIGALGDWWDDFFGNLRV